MIIAILVVISQVIIHEYGHYFMAMRMGIPVIEFSVGFGPKIWQIKNKTGTLISFRAIPLGGYCNIKDLDESNVSDIVPIRKQIPIYLGGVVFNLISCIILTLVFSFIALPKAEVNSNNSIAVLSQVKAIDGTAIKNKSAIDMVTLDGRTFTSTSELTEVFHTVNLTGVERNMTIYLSDLTTKQTVIVPQITNMEQRYGVMIYKMGLWSRAKYGYGMFSEIVGMQLDALKMITNKVLPTENQIQLQYITPEDDVQLQSIVGFVADVDKVQNETGSQRETLMMFIYSFITIGVALAVFNLIPIPCLDGGRIFIAIIEGVTRRNIATGIKKAFVVYSFVIIISFSVFIMAKDVIRLML